jgi:nitrite reductase/ring-hydroxylating ferredoxin subunit
LHSAAQANVRWVAFASAASIVVPGLASGTTQGTLPWSWYSDSELLRHEQERIFQRGWQYAGPAEHAAEPGDYFTCDIGDVPVVVTRDRSGELHALLNVCRHRGSIVVEGRGNRETLQCRYHAWTYGLDGRLRAAPRSREEPGFDADGIALRELAIERWGPLLFVHVDVDAPPLAETLGPLPELLGEGGIEVDRLRFRRRSEFEIACNCKIAVENYLDYFFPEDVSEAEVEELLAFDDQVGLEDRALVESVQAGVRSGLIEEGRLLPESERLIAHFQQLVREAVV